MSSEPMKTSVHATVARPPVKPRSFDLLLRHCLTFEGVAEQRVPAQERLVEALGPDLARRLVTSLTAADRR